MGVLELFESQALSTPEATALILESTVSYSYGDLNSIADSLAIAFVPAMSGSEDNSTPLVCLLMDRHMPLIASMLAILKCGAAYVPVDPSFPPDRQAYIFAHSKCFLLVADEESYDAAIKLGIQVPPAIIVSKVTGKVVSSTVPSNSTTEGKSLESFRSLTQTRDGGGLQYVLYTSGSTGKPKGVMVKAGGVENIVSYFRSELGTGAHSKVLGITTHCFDISVLEIYLPLISGGTLVLAEASSQKNPFRLIEVIQQFGVTVFQATPTTYEMLLVAGWKGDMNIDFLVGGEAFRLSLFPLLGKVKRIINVYGPTETTIWSTAYTLPSSVEEIPQSMANQTSLIRVPIGSAISETDLFLAVVDPADPSRYIESATEGELWIGGAGVAAGYLHAPDLTAGRFIANPFGSGTVYRTGDLVERLESGEYVFIKRLDDQVKIDGFRIELAEVENVYCAIPVVEQAVAVVLDNKLVLYLKIRGNKELSADERRSMQETAARSLTHYMVPKYTVFVKEFSLTASGKLDRKALPTYTAADATDGSGDTSTDIDYATALETKSTDKSMADHICDIIQAVKGRRPKPTAFFTALGVDSLGAVLFIRNLSDSVGGIHLDPSKVYAPGVTISALAKDIYYQLQSEKPEVLRELNITRPPDDDAHDVEGGVARAREDIDAEADFEGGMITNMHLLEGMRGVLTFLVLWDHYHPKDVFAADAIQSDTSLFMIITGFTTAIQLRDPPQKEASGDVIKPRGQFNFMSFFISRLIGIFPILYVCLAIAAPRWKERDDLLISRGFYTREQSNTCVVLYIIGMQSWLRPQCKDLGANTTLYASLIWNVFLIYGALRLILAYMQNHIMKWSKTPSTDIKSFIGDIISMVSYNRTISSVAVVVTVFWFFFIGAALVILWGFIYYKNGLTYITFFVGGAAAASVAECLHWASWNRHLYFDIWTLADLFPSEQTSSHSTPAKVSPEPGATTNPWDRALECSHGESAISSGYSPFRLFWRFSPDMLAVLCAFAMNNDAAGNRQAARVFTWLIVPFITLAYLVIVSLQRGDERKNISRYFLENPVMNILGYCSYPIYLLQEVATGYYGPMFSDDIRDNGFRGSQLWVRVVFIIILIAISWMIQYLIQDILVAKLYGVYISYIMKRNAKKLATKDNSAEIDSKKMLARAI